MAKTLIELLREALDHLESYCDEGPPGEGWKSDELKSLCSEIRKRLRGEVADWENAIGECPRQDGREARKAGER